ncbi:uncharacterized protein LOC128796717 isoform X2 [Vidua chalybeata]|uniref:uncharacterized protein LOC128796717 isoform X2 n=1 Tax=Vidua chalybeata TaxID=81927 RepID=UPI0023A83589|nr:uncharacterized protein LOC128796717 isoform X2 [Vidua chalybeata]
MALALRLFLPLLLAVALPARAAQAAPLQVQGADEHARKASPAAWLHADFQPLKPPAEMDREAVLKAEFPGGSSGSLAASAAGREAMPGTVTGDEHARKASPAAWLHADFQPLKPPAGVSAGKTFQAPFRVAAHKPSSHRRGPPRGKNKPTGDSKSLEASKHMEKTLRDVERRRDAAGTSTHAGKTWKSMRRVFCWGTPFLVKLMAIVVGAALCLMICSAGVWYSWKRKWCSCPSSEDKPNNSGKENLTRLPSSSLLSPSALPQLQHPLEPFPKLTPPQRDPPPLSPLVLFPNYD